MNAEWRKEGIADFQFPIANWKRDAKSVRTTPIGFESGSFFGGHFFVSPYATSNYANSNWLRLVMARFRTHPYSFPHGAHSERGFHLHPNNFTGARWNAPSRPITLEGSEDMATQAWAMPPGRPLLSP